jgi:hypothetical protein
MRASKLTIIQADEKVSIQRNKRLHLDRALKLIKVCVCVCVCVCV